MEIVSRPPPLPPRPRNANKVTSGRVVVIGGSRGMAGAPSMAALGAHRAGAGLVRIAVPPAIFETVAAQRPESMCVPVTGSLLEAIAHDTEDSIREAIEGWDVVVLGPGLGRKPGTAEVVRTLTLEMTQPLVLDADGLFAWGGDISGLAARAAATVLTPHEGEAARLLGTTSKEIRADRAAAARTLAEQSGAVVVLKGPNTIVTDGTQVYVNESGGPVLATGGSGDVLAGLIGGLLGTHGLSTFDAGCIGVYAHGAAADLIAGGRDRGLLATELAAGIPDVLAGMRG